MSGPAIAPVAIEHRASMVRWRRDALSTPHAPDLDISRLRADYGSGARTPTDVVGEIIEQCNRHATNPIWIYRVPEAELRARAEELEARGPGELPLYGVPFAVKDNIDVENMPTTAACETFRYVPSRSAPAVDHLLDAGAILVGKTNLDQFATGLVGTRSPWGACRNAFDEAYISGGSSSGSAVAVALGMASFALGTDTAGSGRVPAAFNNLVGLKPSLGRISTRGVVPACRSLDCVSVFALTAADAAEILDIAGIEDPDHPRSRSFEHEVANITGAFTFAVPDATQLTFLGNDAYAKEFWAACERMESLGGKPVAFDYAPFAETAELLYGGPWVAERYHAARSLVEGDPNALLPVIRGILNGARNYDAVDAFDAFYRLEELAHSCRNLWKLADVMVLPTAPTHPTIAAVEVDPIARNSDLGTYTNFVNLLDLAAVAVPAGFSGANDLPFGITLIAPAGRDHALLSLAGRFHADTGLRLGATGHEQPRHHVVVPQSAMPEPEWVEIAVCGAHLSEQPLNHQLTDRGGRLVRATATAPDYRMYALAGGPPERPGLVRSDIGSTIQLEVWELPAGRVGGFIAGIPAPLGVGRVSLEDGSEVLGFLCEASATADAVDITEFGDWRSYLEANAT